MTRQDRNGVQINRVHAGAICTEIGERLQATLAANSTRLPPHLVRLTELLDKDSVARRACLIEADLR
jgi:hypothetical protein